MDFREKNPRAIIYAFAQVLSNALVRASERTGCISGESKSLIQKKDKQRIKSKKRSPQRHRELQKQRILQFSVSSVPLWGMFLVFAFCQRSPANRTFRFSWLLRGTKARSFEALVAATRVDRSNPGRFRGWFQSCGYGFT